MNSINAGLSADVVAKLKEVFGRYSEIKKVVLYGSRAMQNYKLGSDIDLTIFSDSLSLTQLLKIETEIDDLLLPYKVDLSLYSQIDNLGLIDHINRVGVEFYKG